MSDSNGNGRKFFGVGFEAKITLSSLITIALVTGGGLMTLQEIKDKSRDLSDKQGKIEEKLDNGLAQINARLDTSVHDLNGARAAFGENRGLPPNLRPDAPREERRQIAPLIRRVVTPRPACRRATSPARSLPRSRRRGARHRDRAAPGSCRTRRGGRRGRSRCRDRRSGSESRPSLWR